MRITTRWAACAALLLTAGAAMAQINVRVNGALVPFNTIGPREMNGRVMVPLRGVLEQMGAYVSWDAATQTVIADRGDMSLSLPIGSRTATVNGRIVDLDVPATTIAGTTMVPLRFVSQSLGADVRWDSPTQTVYIETAGRTAYNPPVVNYPPPNPVVTYPPSNPVVTYPPANPPPVITTPAPPARLHRTERFVLTSGTVLPVRLDSPLNSRDAQVGDRFTATVQPGYNVPDGTRVTGVIREAIPASGGKPGVLDFDIRRIEFADGQSRAINASLMSLDDKNVIRHSDGTIEARPTRRNDQLKWVGIGAAGGLIVGALTKQNTLLSLLLGAGGGFLYDQLANKDRRAGNVNLKTGTEFGVRLDRDVAFNRDLLDNNSDLYYRR